MRESKLAYSVEEAAECTGIGRNTLRKLIEWKKESCSSEVIPWGTSCG